MTIPAAEWLEDAACKDMPLDVFFTVENRDEARKVCAHCPVRQDCLDYALKYRMDWGMWGGTTENQRAQMRAKPRRQRLKQELQTAREAS